MKFGFAITILLVCYSVVTAATIDRRTFRLSLPDSWREEQPPAKVDRQSFAMFRNDDLCLFAVNVYKKSPKISFRRVLEVHTKELKGLLMPRRVNEFHQWHNYKGDGIDIQGWSERRLYHHRAFVFESRKYICAIVESATKPDWDRNSRVYDLIGRSFLLKP